MQSSGSFLPTFVGVFDWGVLRPALLAGLRALLCISLDIASLLEIVHFEEHFHVIPFSREALRVSSCAHEPQHTKCCHEDKCPRVVFPSAPLLKSGCRVPKPPSLSFIKSNPQLKVIAFLFASSWLFTYIVSEPAKSQMSAERISLPNFRVNANSSKDLRKPVPQPITFGRLSETVAEVLGKINSLNKLEAFNDEDSSLLTRTLELPGQAFLFNAGPINIKTHQEDTDASDRTAT